MTEKRKSKSKKKRSKRVRGRAAAPKTPTIPRGRPPMDPAGPLGQRIHDLAVEHFGSRNKLAKAAGIVSSRLSETIRGKSVPTMRTLERIADACGITLSQLLDEAPDAA